VLANVRNGPKAGLPYRPDLAAAGVVAVATERAP
jgi:hypothetical protein